MCFVNECPAEFFVSRARVARKEHRCYECWKAINPGEEYHHVKAKWEGQIDDCKVCRGCSYWRWRIFNREKRRGCIGAEAKPPYGGLNEYLPDYEFPEIPVPSSFSVRRHVLAGHL